MRPTPDKPEDISPSPDALDPDIDGELAADDLAIRRRLRTAFASMTPSDGFADRIRAALAEAPDTPEATEVPPAAKPRHRPRVLRGPWRYVTPAVAAAAAAMLLLVFFLRPQTPPSSSPRGSQPQLAGLHLQTIARGKTYFGTNDYQKIAAKLRSDVGFQPIMPKPADSDKFVYCGCKTDNFLAGEKVATYVLLMMVQDKPTRISVVVTTRPREKLGFKKQLRYEGLDMNACGYEQCRMVAMELDGRTYVAIGQVPQALLEKLLYRIATGPRIVAVHRE